MTLALNACEKADTTGVSFKPAESDLKAYQTSLVVMVARQVGRERLLGQGGTWRATGILREGWQALPGFAIVVNDKEAIPVDERGIASMDGLEAGDHTLSLAKITSRREGHKKCTHGHHHHDKCEFAVTEKIYSLPIKVEKDKMTVLLIDFISEQNFRFYAEVRSHDFILERVLRSLARRALSVEKLLNQFEGVLAGTVPYKDWQGLFAKGGRDSQGLIDDWLLAHRYRVDTGLTLGTKLAATVVSFDEKGTQVLAKAVSARMQTYHRLILNSSSSGPGGWQIVSMGVNPPKGKS